MIDEELALEDPADFAGRTAVVTGAGGGVGSAVAGMLLARGARVALVHRSPSDRVSALLAGSDDTRCRAFRVDLTDAEACAATFAEIRAALGPASVLVHAAGPRVPMVHLGRLGGAEITAQLVADAGTAINAVQAALGDLRETAGSIVIVTSAATDRHPVRDGLSSVPKGAIEAYVRGLAVEEGRFGVRANCVGPGMLTDGMAADLIEAGELDEAALEAARRNIPLRAFGRAADIAESVCFLASHRARLVSGQKLNVDGGYSV